MKMKNIFRSIFKQILTKEPKQIGKDSDHPWYKGVLYCRSEKLSSYSNARGINKSPINLASPILFLARGHSGTRALAKLLDFSGVYIGNPDDRMSLNHTYDSMYWSYGFQRTLVPELFSYGKGINVDEELTIQIGLKCLHHHLDYYNGGRWGIKTCAGMFSHPLYNYLFPQAKYIYLVRDGRDVVLSHKGTFHGVGASQDNPHWDYFRLITFGISDDVEECPFVYPEKPPASEKMKKHKYWLQAKSWMEHARMVEHLREVNMLSENIHFIRYEDMCRNPDQEIRDLFEFLELDFTNTVKDYSRSLFHKNSIGRWKNYKKYTSGSNEDLCHIFEMMEDELSMLGY